MSVLSELFQEIANAIRTKTGETAKIAPGDFPAQISTIEGTGANANWVVAHKLYSKGKYSPTVTGEYGVGSAVFEHGLSVVPDIILFKFTAANEISNRTTQMAIGLSSAAQAAIASSDYLAGVWCVLISALTRSPMTAAEAEIKNAATYGHIRECNESTFKVGGTLIGIPESGEVAYNVTSIGNIF